MGKTKKKIIFEKIRKLKFDCDCDDDFIPTFEATYSVMYETIFDLSTDKQILITVKAMTVGVRTQRVQIDRLLKGIGYNPNKQLTLT
jgi:hypothetical protein